MKSKAKVLILGKHASLSRGVIEILEAAGYSGTASQTDRQAIEWRDARRST